MYQRHNTPQPRGRRLSTPQPVANRRRVLQRRANRYPSTDSTTVPTATLVATYRRNRSRIASLRTPSSLDHLDHTSVVGPMYGGSPFTRCRREVGAAPK